MVQVRSWLSVYETGTDVTHIGLLTDKVRGIGASRTVLSLGVSQQPGPGVKRRVGRRECRRLIAQNVMQRQGAKCPQTDVPGREVSPTWCGLEGEGDTGPGWWRKGGGVARPLDFSLNSCSKQLSEMKGREGREEDRERGKREETARGGGREKWRRGRRAGGGGVGRGRMGGNGRRREERWGKRRG